ncbi:MAG TPA: pentapeptide repeat-containing protein [Solirubrobacteraceae bacterium]|nr:pentapeptide repeat-containing protein [Solirubrobacteraceae bacterium]
MSVAKEPFVARLDPDVQPREVDDHELAFGLEDTLLRDQRVGTEPLKRFSLLDCRLERCDLAGLQAREASWVRVVVTGSRLTGADLAGGRLQDVTFRDCRMDLASFAGARMERVSFERCDLRESDLGEARLHDVRLAGCDLTSAYVADASCSRTELRDGTYEDLRGIGGLKGCSLAWPDLMALAPALAAQAGMRLITDSDA